MSIPITVPKLGLTMEEATLVSWAVAPGTQVAKGDTLFSIETDKINYDVEAEGAGFVDRTVAEGETVVVGAVVGYLLASPDEGRPVAAAAPKPEAVPAPVEPAPVEPAPSAAVDAAPQNRDKPGRRYSSPLARRIATENDIAIGDLIGTGPRGVILKRDVEKTLAKNSASTAVAQGSAARRPLTAMRKAISQRMAHSLASTAQMTGFGKVDMTDVVEWRAGLLDLLSPEAPRPTYTDIVVKACAVVLRELPILNSYIDGSDVVTWEDVNVGIAVAVDGGLLVPVIRNADRLTLLEIAAERIALIERARSGKIAPPDLEGGTFTVSNFGSYGGDFETPILNAPQSALLGIGRIADEPAVRDKQIVIRAIMMMSLTFDHRLIDGADAGKFRSRLRDLLEQPSHLLAQLR